MTVEIAKHLTIEPRTRPDGKVHFEIHDEGRRIGDGYLIPDGHSSSRARIGFGLDRAQRGNGLGRHAVCTAIEWAFAHGFDRLWVTIVTDGQAKSKAAEHIALDLGFQRAPTRDMFRVGGVPHLEWGYIAELSRRAYVARGTMELATW